MLPPNLNPMKEIEINQQKEKKIEIKDNSKRAKILLTVFGVLIVLNSVGLLIGYNEMQILKKSPNRRICI